jgi:hypothetical protein
MVVVSQRRGSLVGIEFDAVETEAIIVRSPAQDLQDSLWVMRLF